MLRSLPQPIDISFEKAAEAYPLLCAYVTRSLHAHHVPAPNAVFDALDASAPDAGARLSSFEQNYTNDLPEEIDNFWRILCALSDVLTSSTPGGSGKIMPWMAAVIKEITGVTP